MLFVGVFLNVAVFGDELFAKVDVIGAAVFVFTVNERAILGVEAVAGAVAVALFYASVVTVVQVAVAARCHHLVGAVVGKVVIAVVVIAFLVILNYVKNTPIRTT